VEAATDHLTRMQAAGSWDTEELTYEKHHPEAAAAAAAAGGGVKDGRPSLEEHHRGIFSIPRLHKQHKEKTHPLDWGYPGELAKDEVACYVSASTALLWFFKKKVYLLSGLGYTFSLEDFRLQDLQFLHLIPESEASQPRCNSDTVGLSQRILPNIS
jgi:hypothetical protein